MSEYWKSQAKKFCEICKVWFADNRASIEHHESGQKHKAMVQQRLREMGQKAKDKEKEQGALNATLVAMEAAALAAMRRDGQEVPEAQPTCSAAPKRKAPVADPKAELKDRKRKLKELRKTAKQSQFWDQSQADEFVEWVQGDAEGQPYYWNIFSGETAWEVPKLFYTAEEYSQNFEKIQQKIEEEKQRLAEEERRKQQEAQDQEAQRQYYEQYQQYMQQYQEYQQQIGAYALAPPPPPDQPPAEPRDLALKPELPETEVAEVPVPIEIRAQVDERPVKEESPQAPEQDQPKPECTVYAPLTDEEARPKKRSAYGEWTPVVKSPPRIVDLQQNDVEKVYDDLPTQESKPEPDFDEVEYEAETEFTAKTLPAKSTKKAKPVAFQKRKAQRSTRTKMDD